MVRLPALKVAALSATAAPITVWVLASLFTANW